MLNYSFSENILIHNFSKDISTTLSINLSLSLYIYIFVCVCVCVCDI